MDVLDLGHSSSVTEEILAKKVRPLNASSDLRRVCRTQVGRYCLVPSGTRPKDSIFVLLGAKLPFVLRWSPISVLAEMGMIPWEESPDFRVVGPCCAHDLMFGHVISAAKGKKGANLMDVRLL